MKPAASILLLALAAAAAPSCGKKGPLQMPLVREPQAVSQLAARQRGTHVLLEWKNPTKYADGRALEAIGAIEIWTCDGPAGTKPGPSASRPPVSGAAMVRRLGPGESGLTGADPARPGAALAFLLPLVRLPGRPSGALTFYIRVLDERRRPSVFSAPASLEPRACPQPPSLEAVRVEKDRLILSWAPPESNVDGSSPAAVAGYTVLRSEEQGPFRPLTAAPVAGPPFEDREFRFGRTYAYVVRSCAPGTGPVVESDDSEALTASPRDVFAPDPPSGLIGLAGPDAVSLSWNPCPDADLAGYRVWRREAGEGEFAPLSVGLVPDPAFTDDTARRCAAYVYAVSACDRAGNEGPKSQTGPIALKGRGS